MGDPRHRNASFDYQVRTWVNEGSSPEGKSVRVEYERRQKQQAPAATVAAPPRAPTPTIAAPSAPALPPVMDLWDRVHKHAETRYGGYVLIGPVHDQSDGDPFKNSGWPVLNDQAATINLGLAKAAQMLQKVKPSERVALIVLSSGWTENVLIDSPRIDILGIGRPRLRGQYTVSPQADTSFFNLDIYGTDSTQPALWYHPVPPGPPLNFVAVPPGLYNCHVYGSKRAFYSQRRLHVEDSQFFQAIDCSHETDFVGCVRFEVLGGEWGWSEMKGCQIYAYIDGTNAMTSGALPAGVAIEARAMAPGDYYINKLADQDCWAHPSSGLLLDNCDIYGALYVEQWAVKHRHSRCIAPLTGPEVGGVYVQLRGQPLLDSGGAYKGDAPALVFFDHTTVKCRMLANALGWYTHIGPHYGRSYVNFRHSEHLVDWKNVLGVAFGSDLQAVAVADIVQSPTPATTWQTAGVGWAVVPYGDCPVNVTGLRDLYTL